MQTSLRILTCRGAEMADWLDEVARLRCEIFRGFPYLYDGDAAYERHYLASYARTAGSLLVLVLADDQVVGASTGLPLKEADSAFQQPFLRRGMQLDEVFYCGESVLSPAFRGMGLGHRFFDEREAHARSLAGMRWISFASVDRAADDERRPVNYRSHDKFWVRRGYQPQVDMKVQLPWKLVGDADETKQVLTMWLRPLEADK